MAHRRCFVWACALAIGVAAGSFGCAAAIAPQDASLASDDGPVAAVQGLIGRVLGAASVPAFNLELAPSSTGPRYEIDAPPAGADAAVRVTIRGDSGVSLAAGVGWYIKYYANGEVSWGNNGTGDQLDLPNPLPSPTAAFVQTSPVNFSYAWNVCTLGYTASFWDWARYEREIDFNALNGVNMPLTFVGQEALWAAVYTDPSIGLSEADVEAHFSGPAFLPWERMGNMRGWGGPLTPDLRGRALALLKQILQRQRSLGMISVLPCFAGHVPKALMVKYPTANITRSPDWGGFSDSYCCDYLLGPEDPLFVKIGSLLMKTIEETVGFEPAEAHWYQCDTYNEMTPASSDPAYIKAAGAAVIDAIKAGDPKGKWLMQGWLFHEGYWKDTSRVKAYLSGVADTDMMILDLNADASPVFSSTQSFFGKPFVWNMLLNYGGRRGMYGNMPHIASQPLVVESQRPANTMVGTGFTPEAIENNPVMFELMMEMAWRSEAFSLDQWVANYTSRRYGCDVTGKPCPTAKAAWKVLQDSVYTSGGISVSLIELSPALTMNANTAPNATAVAQAFRMMADAAASEMRTPLPGPFEYDMVDLTSQSLSNLFVDLHNLFRIAYQRWQLYGGNSTAQTLATGDAVLAMIQDMDALLATNVNYLLGTWTAAARAMATPGDDSQEALMEFNARNQVTLWGPTGNIDDYAAKRWAGLVGDYYYRRWKLLVDGCKKCISQATPTADCAGRFPANYSANLFAVEWAWNKERTHYPTTPTGDLMTQVNALRAKYFGNPAGYKRMPGTDYPGNDISPDQPAWTRDIGQLQFLCDADPTCLGFNTNGWLKNVTSSSISSPADFYMKVQ